MANDRKPWLRPHDPTMDLPAGKTCGDCSHFTRCNLIYGHIAADEVCDWSPSLFRPESRAAGVQGTLKERGRG
jgi:hypothetical protein